MFGATVVQDGIAINGSRIGVKFSPGMNSEGRDDEWPALPMILSPAPSAEPVAVNEALLAKNMPEKEEIQKAEVHGPSASNDFQGPTSE
jgi:hypothetical protein